MHTDEKASDDKAKSDVRRMFAEGRLDPNVATARLLELDRRQRRTEAAKNR